MDAGRYCRSLNKFNLQVSCRIGTLAARYEQEIEVRGHLIDSMILTRIFDIIMDLKGNFEVLQFKVGTRKSDPSYARLLVKAKTGQQLDEIL